MIPPETTPPQRPTVGGRYVRAKDGTLERLDAVPADHLGAGSSSASASDPQGQAAPAQAKKK
mgnify:CR=1 FL=1